MMGIGGFSIPIDVIYGIGGLKDICTDYRMIDGTFWPIPITLSTDEDVKAGDEIPFSLMI